MPDNQVLSDASNLALALNQCQRESVQQTPARSSSETAIAHAPALLPQRSDPESFSRTSVSISAAYGEDDGRTEWQVTDDRDGYVHVELYELRFVGPPFNRDSRIRMVSLMVKKTQAKALLDELVEKLSPVIEPSNERR